MSDKTNQLRDWVASRLNATDFELNPLKGDASFRCYYRVRALDRQWILMDSPPHQEPIAPFVAIANSWFKQSIPVPEIFHADESKGFILMADFDDQVLQYALQEQNVDYFYDQALTLLPRIQQSNHTDDYHYPLFNEQHIRLELSYFKDWFLNKLLHFQLSAAEEVLLADVFETLVQNCLQQPQAVIHRDYHSRNLMVLQNQTLGVLDFQDAMIGPITYDAVSLLKDCYIEWPIASIHRWLRGFYAHHPLLTNQKFSFEQVQGWFDHTGLQRHLKVLGIFARLKLRDGKSGYLVNLPRILDYILEAAQRYPHLWPFEQWLRLRTAPVLKQVLQSFGVPAETIPLQQIGSA